MIQHAHERLHYTSLQGCARYATTSHSSHEQLQLIATIDQFRYLDQQGEGPRLVAHGRVGAFHPCVSPLGAGAPLKCQSLQVMLTHHPPQSILGAPIICLYLQYTKHPLLLSMPFVVACWVKPAAP